MVPPQKGRHGIGILLGELCAALHVRKEKGDCAARDRDAASAMQARLWHKYQLLYKEPPALVCYRAIKKLATNR
jgi:hypothetical protein